MTRSFKDAKTLRSLWYSRVKGTFATDLFLLIFCDTCSDTLSKLRQHIGMSLESKWLIRSGGRISGPFSANQIPQLLKSREVQLRDEIAEPLSRWSSIEFHPEFADEVESFKRQIMSENTEVSLTPAGHTNATQTMTDLSDHELTEEITNSLFTNTKEIVVDDVKEEKALNSKDIYSAQYQLQGLKSNPVLDRKVKQTSIWIQMTTLALVAVIGLGFFLWTQSKKSPNAKLSDRDFKAKILSEIELGQYERALALMKSRSDQPRFIDDYGIYFSLLLLQVEDQSLLARRALDQLLSTQPNLRVRVLSGLGLSYMIDGQWSRSIDYFTQAAAADRSFTPALVNTSIAASLMKEKAELDRMMERGFPSDGEAVIAVSALALEGSEARYLQGAQARLQALVDRNPAFRIEGLVFKGLIDAKLTGRPVSNSVLEEVADSDPNLRADHRYNVFVYRKHLNWDNFLNSCLNLGSSGSSEGQKRLLEAICYYRAGEFSQARSIMEQLIDQNPKHALYQAWYALSLKESGSPEQASVALGRSMEFNKRDVYKLPLLLQARFCESASDRNCAYEAWKKLLEVDYNNLSALAGMAKINFENGAVDEAQRLLQRGLGLSSEYKPFLELKAMHSSERKQ